MSDTIKKYLDLPGLQEYDAGVKAALNKKVNSNDMENYVDQKVGDLQTEVERNYSTYDYVDEAISKAVTGDLHLSASDISYADPGYGTDNVQEVLDMIYGHHHDDKYLKLSGGSVTGDLSVAGSFLVGGKPTARYLGNNSPYLFIGTTAEYEAANTAGTIPVGTIVIITDDGDSSDDITTAVLGTAKLGYMILGNQ